MVSIVNQSAWGMGILHASSPAQTLLYSCCSWTQYHGTFSVPVVYYVRTVSTLGYCRLGSTVVDIFYWTVQVIAGLDYHSTVLYHKSAEECLKPFETPKNTSDYNHLMLSRLAVPFRLVIYTKIYSKSWSTSHPLNALIREFLVCHKVFCSVIFRWLLRPHTPWIVRDATARSTSTVPGCCDQCTVVAAMLAYVQLRSIRWYR